MPTDSLPGAPLEVPHLVSTLRHVGLDVVEIAEEAPSPSAAPLRYATAAALAIAPEDLAGEWDGHEPCAPDEYDFCGLCRAGYEHTVAEHVTAFDNDPHRLGLAQPALDAVREAEARAAGPAWAPGELAEAAERELSALHFRLRGGGGGSADSRRHAYVIAISRLLLEIERIDHAQEGRSDGQ